MADSENRDRFESHLADIVDGTGDAELLELIANSDEFRDERHWAEQVVRLVRHAGDDHVPEISAHPAGTQPASTPASRESTTTSELLQPLAVATTAAGVITTAASAEPAPQAAPEAAAPTPAANEVAAIRTEPAPRVIHPPMVEVDPVRGHVAAWVALAIAVVLGLLIVIWGSNSHRQPTPSETELALDGVIADVEKFSDAAAVEICEGSTEHCRMAEPKTRVKRGMLVRTNLHARAHLEPVAGLRVTLDRDTSLLLGGTDGATMHLDAGTIVIDPATSQVQSFTISTPLGLARLDRAKCSISAQPRRILLEVTRGRIKWTNTHGHEAVVLAGESARVAAGQQPEVTATRSVGDVIASSEPDNDRAESSELSRGLGQLRAKKPGESSERDHAVRLTRHHVNAHIVGAIAKVEVDEVFTNDTSDVLEGIFRFPLPADAQIERLALEVDGRLVEGAFTDRERAAAIWRGSIVQAAPQLRAQIKDDIVWVPGPWRDPALLEWQRGNRFELRIYPIPKLGSRRIVLSYTQVVPATSGVRRFSYPLPQHTTDPRGVDDFSFELTIRGHEVARAPTIRGYAGQFTNTAQDASHYALAEQRFLPRGDLSVDFDLPSDARDMVAWAHRADIVSDPAFVAMLVRPRLRVTSEQLPRSYAFVVDTSRSMFGENLRRAAALTERMIRELSSDDRVVLLACDSECRNWPKGLVQAGSETAEAAAQWLKQQTADGASDLSGAIESAVSALPKDAAYSRQVIYLGDGTPTAGATRPATIQRAVRQSVGTSGAMLTAVAVGADSDLESLRALARGNAGVVIPFVPGTGIGKAAFAILSATYGARLIDPEIELPAGITAIAPEHLDAIAAGDEVLLVGRLSAARVQGDVVLRGRVNDRPFEQRYPLTLEPVEGGRHAFVPRLYAATRLRDLERRGDPAAKAEAIELSRRFSVASRYTSLLVLESQAMFDAFGLDNRRRSEVWTGELETSPSSADASDDEPLAESKAAEASDLGSGTLGAPAALSVGAAKAKASARAEAAESSGAMSASASAARRPGAVNADEFAAPPPAPARPSASVDGTTAAQGQPLSVAVDPWLPEPPTQRRRMIPMRRIWERKGEVATGKNRPSNVSPDKLASAERELARDPDRRSATKKLFDLYMQASNLAGADELVERWSQRDPLDVEALVGRADVAARRGNRALAIRILGSVVDVRPGDEGAQTRLGRLYRWQGQADRACRFAVALSEFRPNDEKVLTEALRCLSEIGRDDIQSALRSAASETTLRAAERLLAKPRPVDGLSGDLRMTATWQGSSGVDVDLAFIDPDAHRVSWLGAPTRAVISATSVASDRQEGLALRGGKPGEYLVEVTRGSGSGIVQGTITLSVAGMQRQIPFTLDADRVVVGIVKIYTVPKLVPLSSWPTGWR